MAPVILEMDVHCSGCAKKIRKTINNLFGVKKVWVSPDTGLVVVAGSADAAVLRRRIQNTMRKPVTIISHGAARPDVAARTHFGTPPHYALPPSTSYGYGWGMAPPPHPYGAPQHASYPYAGNYWAPPPHARW